MFPEILTQNLEVLIPAQTELREIAHDLNVSEFYPVYTTVTQVALLGRKGKSPSTVRDFQEEAIAYAEIKPLLPEYAPELVNIPNQYLLHGPLYALLRQNIRHLESLQEIPLHEVIEMHKIGPSSALRLALMMNHYGLEFADPFPAPLTVDLP